MTSAGGWNRLHPLSPIVRGGRGSLGAGLLLLPVLLGGRLDAGALFPLGILAVVIGLGFVSWLVTRWRIDGDDLLIETGVLRRRSLRFPLAQVQAIDVVRPGLARVLGVAQLRLRMGGSSGGAARLSYVSAGEVARLRAELLALAHGTAHDPAAPPEQDRATVLSTVPTGRLIGSILLSDAGFYAELALLALLISAIFKPGTAVAVLSGGGLVWLLGVITIAWRRFNQEFRLTVAESHSGLHLTGGLIALTSETIRPGRVQAVRMVEPLLWRPLGWCRLQVDLAGRQRSDGEGQAERRQLRAVLPVGDRELADTLLDRLVPERPHTHSPPPPRARFKTPLRYHLLGWSTSDTCVVTTTGRLRRTTVWVPLEKVQSLRRVQGPIQRWMQLASVHLDTAGRSVRATLRDRDVSEADQALSQLAELARTARRAQ